ncbi:MAG: ABC transporter ATP-binding protein [Vicinamibacteria bacterium]
MTETPVIRVRNITVRRGARAVVRDVSLDVANGERVALVGPNAAGKSTFLSSIAGLLPIQSGSIDLCGQSLSVLSGRQIARQVALVVALYEGAPKLTVRESTELGRYPHTGPLQGLTHIDHAVVEHVIAETGLTELADRNLGSLSAGERQRALVARALAQEPRLLLLDEPSAHLDVGHGLDLFALLSAIAERGVAIVAVIHDLVAAAHWASRMIVMSDGRLIDDGSPARVMRGEALGQAFGVNIIEAHSAPGQDGPATWRFERSVRD